MAKKAKVVKSSSDTRRLVVTLRSAASALEHGRHSTARQKLRDADALVIMSGIVSDADRKNLYRYSDANSNTNDLTLADAQRFQRMQNGGTITPMEQTGREDYVAALENLAKLVAAGNTETDRLEEIARDILGVDARRREAEAATVKVTKARADLIPESDWIEREGLHQCQNCLGVFTVDQLRSDIPHYHERVAPSESEPSGECPDCGSLCHPIDTKDAVRGFVEQIARMTKSDESTSPENVADDSIETVDGLISKARDLMKQPA